MQAKIVNNNLMNMIAMGVGSSMPLIVQSPELFKELYDKLKAAQKTIYPPLDLFKVINSMDLM